MPGLIVELIISWILLWLFCRANLFTLGFLPTTKRFKNLLFGFLIAAFCCALYQLSITLFAKNTWTINKQITAGKLADSSLWTLTSVLYEELLFRGALLYILIRKLGIKWACIISAIAFGIYHWFSYNAFGNPIQMIFVFLMTGIWGFMFAMAFAKTRSLYLPIGIHFGWNLLSTVVFSQGPLGHQLLISEGGKKLEGILSLFIFLLQVFAVPLLVWWYLNYQSKKQLINQHNTNAANNNLLNEGKAEAIESFKQ